MKKILLSVVSIAIIGAVAFAGTRAYFSDTKTNTGNTFSAGSIDLKVNGDDVFMPYTVTNLKPGENRGTETYTIKNTGTLPGLLSFKVTNVITNENDLIEPETSAGDAIDTRLDPDGHSIAASGKGELLDQVYLVFWVDDTPGSRPAPFDWQDTKYWSGYPDESTYYQLPVNTDLMAGKNIVLDPGEVMYMGVGVKFIDDTDVPYGWILDGVPNNAAMSDDFSFDIEMGLKQLTP